MKPPELLKGPALAFWIRHAGHLTKSGILSERSEDSFALLCQTWAMVQKLAAFEPGEQHFREMVQFNQMHKNYQSLAKQFGLLPRDAKTSKMDTAAAEATDEFGL